MRMSYLIRSISHWFTRVVYERDHFDASLEEASRELDARLALVFLVARLFVWISRRILWVLMMLGHLVSGYLLRQMEFDADRYEARLAGSDAFEATTRRILRLSTAMQVVHADLEDARLRGWLPEDLAQQTVLTAETFPPTMVEKLNESIEHSRTGALDTHPSDRERIASARAQSAPGVFHLDSPAAELFDDFEDLSRKVTRSFYAGVFGDAVDGMRLRPMEEIIAESERARRRDEAQQRYFLGTTSTMRPIPVPDLEGAEPATYGGDAAADLGACRAAIESGKAAHASRMERLQALHEARFQAFQVAALQDAGVGPDQARVSDPTSSARAALDSAEKTLKEIRALEEEMAPFETLLARRVEIVVRMDADDRIRPVVRMLASLNTLHSSILDLECENAALIVLLRAFPGHERDERFCGTIIGRANDVLHRLRLLDLAAAKIEIPSGIRIDEPSLRKLLVPALPNPDRPGTVVSAAQRCSRRAWELRLELIGDLSDRAERIESGLGLESASRTE
jgi:hypothetical protein